MAGILQKSTDRWVTSDGIMMVSCYSRGHFICMLVKKGTFCLVSTNQNINQNILMCTFSPLFNGKVIISWSC